MMARRTKTRTPKRRKEGSRLLSVWPGAGGELGLSRATTWRRVYDGTIPTLKLGGQRFVDRLDLDALIERLKADARISPCRSGFITRASAVRTITAATAAPSTASGGGCATSAPA